MHIPSPFDILSLLGVAIAAFAIGGTSLPHGPATTDLASRSSSSSSNTRASISALVTQILESMVANDPSTLPLATVYKATENSHGAALSMMTSWHTIVNVGPPSLLAIDTTQGTAYFALNVNERNNEGQSILRGRVKVVDEKISEIELFINRYRGDDGFAFNSTQLPSNYAKVMSPPANRTKSSRAELQSLSEALFSTSNDYEVTIADTCRLNELGWNVVDTGVYGNASSDPLDCSWPSNHPTDPNARTSLVIDEELGLVVTSGIIPGKVYPYNGNVSAFIPDTMTSAQEAQDIWYNEMIANATIPVVAPISSTAETMEVLQYYNGELQSMQINVFLGGPNMSSPWL
ncbi:hypothetical protein BDV39DRAFT_189843 [Aspergillus sergii]|uniref:Uncharacterized protein n=1 Tax=Aspergillus sergii TaxID=1034303 RepID=A0A5N6XIT8_9EURO|nr:hypothetical protein BDV39DRAFT_189843 [Aspergillus sergii]